MRTIIIGIGEVGSALHSVLSEHYNPVSIHDLKVSNADDGPYDIMHVCIPYSENFIDIVKAYRARFQPKHVVIHSSVPIGTSRQCGAVHSPIRGLHPLLDTGIKTFVKFLGGKRRPPRR